MNGTEPTDFASASPPATDRRSMLAGIGGLAAGALLVGKASAGPLDPPAGPIESTGKTLRDVEPRIAINSTNTPGDTDSVYRISSGGSYYLTGNVTASTGKAAIEIAASNVTIDLSGYSITTLSNLAAIRLTGSARTNISIRDGQIGLAGTGGGIDLTPTIGTQTVGGSIENVHVTGTLGTGIKVGDGVLLIGCTGSKNTQIGIQTGHHCVITACSANDNGQDGISTGEGVTLNDCTASGNSLNGLTIEDGSSMTACSAVRNGGWGIKALNNVVVVSCVAEENGKSGIEAGGSCTISRCSSKNNIDVGINIWLVSGSKIFECVTAGNSLSGIGVTTGCTVSDCLSTQNATSGIFAQSGRNQLLNNYCYDNDEEGIVVGGGDNRIEGNHCTLNGTGIRASSFGSFFSRNTCSANATNWNIAAGNVCLVVQAATGGAINGNSGGVSPGSSNPNANYTF